MAALSVVVVALAGVGLTFATSYVAVAHAAARRTVDFQPGAAAVSATADPADSVPVAHRPDVFVLWWAVIFAMPAGAGIWLIANVRLGNVTLAEWIIGWLDPFGDSRSVSTGLSCWHTSSPFRRTRL